MYSRLQKYSTTPKYELLTSGTPIERTVRAPKRKNEALRARMKGFYAHAQKNTSFLRFGASFLRFGALTVRSIGLPEVKSSYFGVAEYFWRRLYLPVCTQRSNSTANSCRCTCSKDKEKLIRKRQFSNISHLNRCAISLHFRVQLIPPFGRAAALNVALGAQLKKAPFTKTY